MYRHKYLPDVSTLKMDTDKCVGCGRCLEVCPHGVFAMENKRARVINSVYCMECGACQRNCRYDAIEVRAGVGCAMAIAIGKLKKSAPACG